MASKASDTELAPESDKMEEAPAEMAMPEMNGDEARRDEKRIIVISETGGNSQHRWVTEFYRQADFFSINSGRLWCRSQRKRRARRTGPLTARRFG